MLKQSTSLVKQVLQNLPKVACEHSANLRLFANPVTRPIRSENPHIKERLQSSETPLFNYPLEERFFPL